MSEEMILDLFKNGILHRLDVADRLFIVFHGHIHNVVQSKIEYLVG